MNDLVIATIRTAVPSFIGTFVLLLTHYGIELDEAGVAGLTAFVISLATAAYYLLVRVAAKKWPALELLLGVAKKPEYKDAE